MELVRDAIQERQLDDLMTVEMKLHSRVAEWVEFDSTPCPRVDLEMQTCQAFIECLEENEVTPESFKIFQKSYNKFNEFSIQTSPTLPML